MKIKPKPFSLTMLLKYFTGLVFIVVFGTQCTSKSGKLVLVENGKSDYRIYLSDNAVLAEKHAASELQKYIYEISACKLPITNKYQESVKHIFVGFKNVPEILLQGIDVNSFGMEEFIIKTSSKDIIIAGGKPRGTLYGVIAFLTDEFGCRWYTPDFNKIPKTKDIIVNAIDKRDKPAFEYREAWYKEAYNTEWAVHNRLNPSIVPIPDSLGGSYITYPFVHTFNALVPPEKYFEKHPEYFSLINGKRKAERHGTQLCLTNPDVLKIATQTVFRWIKEHPKANVFSIDQNDGYGFCECEKCKAIDDAEESHSGTIINFVNHIADTIAQTHPDLRIQTLAYVYSEVPPKNIKPRPNVTIRLCHYEYCCAHAIEQCESHQVFRERLQAWSKIANQITIWDYFTDFNHYLVPFPNFESLKNDVRFYADNNCIGLFAQGCNVPQKGGGEFASLRAWVFARLMWNPYQDAQVLIDEFVENVYGSAAPFIKTYIDLLHEKVKPDSVYFSIYAKPTDGGYLTPDVVQESVNLFKQAEAASANDPDLLKRVELAGLPILYTQLYFYSIGGKVYLSQTDMEATLNKFQRIIKESNITRFAEGKERGDVQAFINRVKNVNKYITNWWIIGPFDNPNANGLNIKYPPETEFDTEKSYVGKNDHSILWKYIENKESGYMDFIKLFDDPNDGVAYARTTMELKQAGKIKIGVGSNDGVKLWINGKLVHNNQTARKAEPNQDILTINLKKGKNDILIKIDQTGGGWGFYFTVLEGELNILALAGCSSKHLDFYSFPKIDAHTHINIKSPQVMQLAKKDNFKLLSVVTESRSQEYIDEQLDFTIYQKKNFPNSFYFTTAFSMESFGKPDWAAKTIERLQKDFDNGAIAVKVYKDIGMVFKDAEGNFIMIDNPAFDPVLDFIASQGKTLVAHIAEPKNCWLPIDSMTVNVDKRYYKKHPEYHMYLHPEFPSYREIIKHRDNMLKMHPKLKVVGCHLGSLEWDVDELAKRFDAYPNFAVDLAARINHLQIQDRNKVRNFIIKYQDRIIYGTDDEISKSEDLKKVLDKFHHYWLTDWKYFSTNSMMTSSDNEFQGLALPEKVLKKLYYENAMKWYSEMKR